MPPVRCCGVVRIDNTPHNHYYYDHCKITIYESINMHCRLHEYIHAERTCRELRLNAKTSVRWL